MIPADTIRETLRCRRSGCPCNRARGNVHCPAHDDDNPSLSISASGLLYCHAGCSQDAVNASLKDMGFRELPIGDGRTALGAVEPHISKVYDYGEFQVVRYEPKDFRQRRPDGKGGWIWNMDGVELHLYRRDEVLAAPHGSRVYIPEGEDDVEKLRELGLIATCNPGGAGKWKDRYSRDLRDKDAVVLQDNDNPGRGHAQGVATSVSSAAASVRIVDLPELREKGDVSDWLAGGHTLADLEDAVENAPLFPSNRTQASSEERILRFYTAEEIASETSQEPQQVALGVYSGSITEIDGKIKSAGKTTYVTHLCRKVIDGSPFLGRPTMKSPVIYLTEQPPSSFKEALRRSGLLGERNFVVLMWHDAMGARWVDIVKAAVAKAIEVGANLIVVDTLPQFAGIRGDGENASGEAMQAMGPIQLAAAQGLAVVVVRHERKGGGDIGESARGSSAFGGAVDTITSIRRGDGNTSPSVRILESISRFDGVPDKIVVELDEGEYVDLGSDTDVAMQRALTAIFGRAPDSEEKAQRLEELLEGITGIKKTTGRDAIAKLHGEGSLMRVGKGVKNDPYRYWKPGIHSSAIKGVEAEERIINTQPDPTEPGLPGMTGEYVGEPTHGPSALHTIHSSASPTLYVEGSISSGQGGKARERSPSEWRKASIPNWRKILSESIEQGETGREEYARRMLNEVLGDQEYGA